MYKLQQMKNLDNLIKEINYLYIKGDTNRTISALAIDSRKCAANTLFVAQKGTQADGHDYIDAAIKNGASVVVCENIPPKMLDSIVYIQVINPAVALGKLSSAFFDFPSAKISLVGITGTNGKTSIATLLYTLVSNMGIKAGLLSTIKVMINETVIEATHTTPDAIQINDYLSKMVQQGCEYAFMEVSSHAAEQSRIAGLKFRGAVFTNLTHDHLDYHLTFANYRDAKKKFFDGLGNDAFALINLDDKNGSFMLQNTKAQKKTFALKNMASFMAKVLEFDFHGTQMTIDGVELWTQFVGQFNASNILAVYATALLLGFKKDTIITNISLLKPVNGRFDAIFTPSKKMVIIDYAHTPDALENVLSTISLIRKSNTKIFVVFGAGGDRDKTKRPEMAQAVQKYADKIIITSDNPRSEEPEAIMDDIYNGIGLNARTNVFKIANRAEAIKVSLSMSAPNDIILIAGKGHENYQEIKGVKHHFNDKELVMELENIKKI